LSVFHVQTFNWKTKRRIKTEIGETLLGFLKSNKTAILKQKQQKNCGEFFSSIFIFLRRNR